MIVKFIWLKQVKTFLLFFSQRLTVRESILGGERTSRGKKMSSDHLRLERKPILKNESAVFSLHLVYLTWFPMTHSSTLSSLDWPLFPHRLRAVLRTSSICHAQPSLHVFFHHLPSLGKFPYGYVLTILSGAAKALCFLKLLFSL